MEADSTTETVESLITVATAVIRMAKEPLVFFRPVPTPELLDHVAEVSVGYLEMARRMTSCNCQLLACCCILSADTLAYLRHHEAEWVMRFRNCLTRMEAFAYDQLVTLPLLMDEPRPPTAAAGQEEAQIVVGVVGGVGGPHSPDQLLLALSRLIGGIEHQRE